MNRLKLVFGIAVPMLVIVVTMVMVGISFAWFTTASTVKISEITMSTAESYVVEFCANDNYTQGNNLPYSGQEAFVYDSSKNGSMLITPSIQSSDSVVQSNTAYYFVNTIALNTKGHTYDISMALDTVGIYRETTTRDTNGNNRNYLASFGINGDSESTSDIPYAFTWMFKEHAKDSEGNYIKDSEGNISATNYSKTEDEKGVETKSMLPLTPSTKETWYTPYGALTFDENGYVKTVNGIDIYSTDESGKSTTTYSIKGEPTQNITDFTTGTTTKDGKEEGVTALYDFYIIFAPEKMFYMQFFEEDRDQYTAQDVYRKNKTDEQGQFIYEKDEFDNIKKDTDGKPIIATETDSEIIKKMFGSLKNQMFYSAYSYAGAEFDFSAIISVEALKDKDATTEGGSGQ